MVLDGENISLEAIAINGAALSPGQFIVSDQNLTIPNVPHETFTLDIVTTCNPQANTALSGLYMSNGIYCTQCEAEGFRRITYYLDRPDVMARFTVRPARRNVGSSKAFPPRNRHSDCPRCGS